MGVHLGGPGALVPQQALYVPQVGAAFQQVGGKGMPQGVYCHSFPDSYLGHCYLQYALYAPVGVLVACLPFEQVRAGLVLLEVFPLQCQCLGRQLRIAVFLSLGLHVPHLHPLRVYVFYLQVNSLAHP